MAAKGRPPMKSFGCFKYRRIVGQNAPGGPTTRAPARPPITVVQGVLYHKSTAHPMKKLTSECITVAKAGNMLPLGLAKGAKLLRDVKRDEVIAYDMVELNEPSVLPQLRRTQDQLFCQALAANGTYAKLSYGPEAGLFGLRR